MCYRMSRALKVLRDRNSADVIWTERNASYDLALRRFMTENISFQSIGVV